MTSTTSTSTQSADTISASPSRPQKFNKNILTCAVYLILLLVVALIIAFCNRSSQDTLRSAITNFYDADNIAILSTNKFDFSDPESSGLNTAKITISASSLDLPANLSIDIDLYTATNSHISTNLTAKITDDYSVFIHTSNLEDFIGSLGLDTILSQRLGEELFAELISSVDEEWWEIDDNALSLFATLWSTDDSSSSHLNYLSCLATASQRLPRRNINFLSATSVKDQDRTYKLDLDADNLAQSLIEPVRCVATTDTGSLADIIDDIANNLSPTYLDINSKNQFARLYTSNDNNSDYSFESVTELFYDEDNEFALPESYTPLSTLILQSVKTATSDN